MKKIIILSTLTICLAFSFGCGHHPIHDDRLTVHHHRMEHVQEYRQNIGNNDWIYWYILMSNSSHTNCPCYYYCSSHTPLTNFSNAQFVPSGKTLPPEIEKDIKVSEPVGKQQDLAEKDEPHDIQIHESDFEKAEAPLDVDIVNPDGSVVPITPEEASESEPSVSSPAESAPSAPSAESGSSSDSGGSSSSDGGGDGGGGGGD